MGKLVVPDTARLMPANPEIESRVTELLDGGDLEQACSVVIESYGQNIFSMLIGVFHSDDVAQDVFQLFSLELWKSLEAFEGRSSVYTWTYVIARRSVTAHRRRKKRSPEIPLGTEQERVLVARWTRTVTDEWRKTETKHKFRELCENLPEDERMLVMLRIGQKMPWNQITEIVHEDPLEPDELKRESARLRKRFERVKDKLRDAITES